MGSWPYLALRSNKGVGPISRLTGGYERQGPNRKCRTGSGDKKIGSSRGCIHGRLLESVGGRLGDTENAAQHQSCMIDHSRGLLCSRASTCRVKQLLERTGEITIVERMALLLKTAS